jgi:hypothetical protein
VQTAGEGDVRACASDGAACKAAAMMQATIVIVPR